MEPRSSCQLANEVAARARERNAAIVFGDLTGLRFDNDEGRYVNDKAHKMPYAKLATILTYKSHLDGRECIPMQEYDTSVTCCVLAVWITELESCCSRTVRVWRVWDGG
ncbi:IS200/IS605 family accessory protein TnpB-related protein [Halobacterium sp. KA-6]|uniref:IS200/IS605 family accessory protein TnpB-related protein n=1 Tax=Halobacterium sp. KA-6 TaxID=2896368 RepID=UPI003FA5712C